jgi:hypothetical protein
MNRLFSGAIFLCCCFGHFLVLFNKILSGANLVGVRFCLKIFEGTTNAISST